jgi:hypothetical protein
VQLEIKFVTGLEMPTPGSAQAQEPSAPCECEVRCRRGRRAALKASGHVRGWSNRGIEWNPDVIPGAAKLAWVSGEQERVFRGLCGAAILVKGRAIASAGDLTSR